MNNAANTVAAVMAAESQHRLEVVA